MLDNLRHLIDLQDSDTEILRIKSLVESQPEEVVELQNIAEASEKNINETNDRIAQLDKERNELIKFVEDKKSLLEASQSKRTNVQNVKEYEAVVRELEINEREMLSSVHDAEVIKEQIEELKRECQDFEKNKTESLSKIEEILSEQKNSLASYISDLDDKVSKREETAKQLPKRLLSKYEQLRSKRANLAVVRVSKGVCQGCGIKVPPQLYVEVKKGEAIQQCQTCLRYLFSDK